MASDKQPRYLDDTLSRKVVFFTGKGGVGKSSVAWATALAARARGKRAAVVSWSPYDDAAKPRSLQNDVEWLALNAMDCFREYALQILKFDTVFDLAFDNHVFRTFIRAAPGVADTVLAGKIWDLYDRGEYDLLAVDLPSSGHSASFFQSPLGVEKLFRIGFVHRDAQKIAAMFRSRDCRVDLVCLPEELSVVESRQLKEKLETILPFHFGFTHFNQCAPELDLPPAPAKGAIPPAAISCLEWHLARLEAEKESESTAKQLGLPLVRLARETEGETAAIVRAIAERLEAA